MSNFDEVRLQLQLPRITSLLFAGAGSYVAFIDPQVRDSHDTEKSQLAHWSSMYNSSKVPMAALATLSTIFGLNAYRLTKEPLWIYGSVAAFAIIPFTFLAIMGINNSLQKDKEKADSRPPTKGLASKFSDWVLRHRIRVLLSVVAAGLFYAAEGKKPWLKVVFKYKIYRE